MPAHAQNHKRHSPASTGFLGLNTMPSARSDPAGTIRGGVSFLDPYLHGYIGVQIAEPLHINIRQSAEVSDITDDAKRLYPGIDLKLRLAKESTYRPSIAIGMQSAFGHKRMAGEYLALSKRYHNFDFTGGIGWGRFGSAAHFDNPLKIISDHFDQRRALDGEEPNTPNAWFTGEDVGLFAGLEYFLPYEGLSLKFDYGADRYIAEHDSFNFNAPAPWSAGISYSYKDRINGALAVQGTDKVMARLSVQANPSKWPLKHTPDQHHEDFDAGRNGDLNIKQMMQLADEQNIAITNIDNDEAATLNATLHIPEHMSAPSYIGRAARTISTHSGPDIERFNLTLRRDGLKGRTVNILRSDLENAIAQHQGSPQEIWQNAAFTDQKEGHFLANKGVKSTLSFALTLDNQISLSEEDSGTLYRSSLRAGLAHYSFAGIITSISGRLDLSDNLDNLTTLRPQRAIPIRSDIYDFTNNRVSIDTAYAAYPFSITNNIHAMAMAGHLEEFFAGYGGEMLYRPFQSRFALGAQYWSLSRRDPNTLLELGLRGDTYKTASLSAWYDIPHIDTTARITAGRFIAGDAGVTLGLKRAFENGATLSGSTSLSNTAEPDIFGGTTHAQHTLNLTLPLGSLRYIPTGSSIRTHIAPFGRDTAQTLNAPLNLHDMTTPLGLNHIQTHWNKIIE